MHPIFLDRKMEPIFLKRFAPLLASVFAVADVQIKAQIDAK